MREQLEHHFNRIIIAGFFLLLFLMPIKFGIPYMEQESFLFPSSFFEWFVLPYWPIEFLISGTLFLSILWLLKIILNPKIEIVWNRYLTLIVLLFGWFCLSGAGSIYPYATKMLLQQFGAYFLLFFLSVQIFSEKPKLIQSALFLLVFTAVIVALFGLYQHFWGLQETLNWLEQSGGKGEKLHYNVLSRLKGERAFGTFIYPNTLAGYLILSIPFSLSLLSTFKKEYKKTWALFFSLLFLISFSFLSLLSVTNPLIWIGALAAIALFPITLFLCLGVTFSKGAFVAGMVAAIAYFIWRKREKYPTEKHRTLWNGLAVLVFAFLFYYKDFILHRLKMPTFGHRVDYWNSALQMVFENPLFGSGLGTFGVLYPLFKETEAQSTQLAHNDYLQLLSETGFIGVGLWLFFIFLLLAKALKGKIGKNRFVWGLYWGSFALWLHHLIDFDLYIPGLGGIEWFVLGALISQITTLKKYAFSKRIFRFIPIGLVLILFLAQQVVSNQLSAKYAFDLAQNYIQTQKYSKGMEWVNKAIEKEPLNATYLLTQGNLYLKAKDQKAALSSFEKASSLNPNWAPPLILQTNIWLKKWREKPSEEHFKALLNAWRGAVDRMPAKVGERVKLARFLEKIGHLEQALIEYRTVLGKLPNDKEIQQKCRDLNQKLSDYFKDQAQRDKLIRSS